MEQEVKVIAVVSGVVATNNTRKQYYITIGVNCKAKNKLRFLGGVWYGKNMKKEYVKKFDEWHAIKKEIDVSASAPSFKEREIWLISVGVNIGSEIDGKGKQFVRPVLVLYKKDKMNFVALPLSQSNSSKRSDYYTFKENSFIIFGQVRTVSGKRMVRRIGRMGPKFFTDVQNTFANYILRENKQ